VERLEIIETLKRFPDEVEAEVAGLSEAVLRHRPAEDEWSIKEVVGHLRYDAEVRHKRLYMVWSLTDPVFVPYDEAATVRENNYQEAELKTLLGALKHFRLQTINLLDHAVDWTRTGTQPGVGRRSLKQLAERALAHDADHLAQIRALKAAHGVSVS
jgi:hypothetical protein